MDYIIREMRSEEYCLLSDFLYEAIYIPEGIEPPPKSVIECPELQEYIVEFGNRKHDKALVAEMQGNVIGAIWVRIMNDYGHIDNDTPSLANVCLQKKIQRIRHWDFIIETTITGRKIGWIFKKYPYPFRKVIMQSRCTRKWDLLLLMKIMRNIL